MAGEAGIVRTEVGGTKWRLKANKTAKTGVEKEDEGTLSIWTDGAALSVWDDGVGAFRCVLADHLVAHDGSTVADADLAGLGFPYILVVVQLSI